MSTVGVRELRQNLSRYLAEHGATLPSASLTDLIARRPRRRTPAGTTDALLAEGRAERA
jgi:hypothetical protein